MEANTTTYLSNRRRLRVTSELFLKLLNLNGKNINSYVANKAFNSSNTLENSYIEYPEDIIGKFRDLYSKKMPQVNIGECDNPKIQFKGIIDIALIVLMSNKVKNYYSKTLEEKKMTEDVEKGLKEQKNKALQNKDDAISDLLSCIFVLENTCEYFKDYFSYGERIDEFGKSTFTMDIPFIGQMSVHYGTNSNRRKILEFAREKTISILKHNKELNLITEEKMNELIKKVNSNDFLPVYGCRLHEIDSSIPLKYTGRKVEKLKEKLDLNKNFKDITEKDLIKLFNWGLNARERHYVGVKMGLSKEQLIFLDRERPFIDSLRDRYTNDCNLDDISKAGKDFTKEEKDNIPGKNWHKTA